MNEDAKKLQVSAIENGTVIDHIPAVGLFNVIFILGLEKSGSMITFGTNFESSKFGKKAIIKVADYFFSDKEIDKIALVAPLAKLNVIKNYTVVEKRQVAIPDEAVGIVKCFNPQCITNHEKVITKFKVIDKEKISLKCHYCQKITDREHMIIF
ncbi:MAG: aspartate carbamoyltransferase regulatory subunit [Bacteroidales bacterium]|nr:aspartate carbamoyltransferase regulatory subunit [Bacteroidales bacterium]